MSAGAGVAGVIVLPPVADCGAPQALYGCDLRDIRPVDLEPLSQAGKAAVTSKAPLRLNVWRAHAVVMGLPLGESAVTDPVAVMRLRQLTWLQVLANFTGISGAIHRAVACPSAQWLEPSSALVAALKSVGWRVERNKESDRGTTWPLLVPEEAYPNDVVLKPVDGFPAAGAAFTDGSIATSGGAAAWRPDMDVAVAFHVPGAASSTE